MKALIVSDSHGLTSELKNLKQQYEQEVDVMIHCGDSELSIQETDGFEIVRGNCDYETSYPNDIVTEVEGIRLFITHGHRYNVKMTLQNVLYKARECQAQVVCFGHSHIMGAEVVAGTLLINPGSIALPRMRKEKTYVLLEIETNVATVQFLDLEGNVVVKRELSLNE
ncbi:metallophosphoesterase [Ectobacillus sp. sgz5001026]|uniref:metallophosphoesterase n=1 Tax=Ectobacillus sp. sgz5001026 TaxID=3242473 RepID=UPI0036D3AA12